MEKKLTLLAIFTDLLKVICNYSLQKLLLLGLDHILIYPLKLLLIL